MIDALSNDLDTPGALACLHEAAAAGDADGLRASASMLGLLTPGMGGWANGGDDLRGIAARLDKLRAEALLTGDFGPVDAMKAILAQAGVEVRMSRAAIDLVPGKGFDPARLAEIA